MENVQPPESFTSTRGTKLLIVRESVRVLRLQTKIRTGYTTGGGTGVGGTEVAAGISH